MELIPPNYKFGKADDVSRRCRITGSEGDTVQNNRLQTGYHHIVYTLVYPGVLGSMLYDLYLLTVGVEQIPRWPVMVLYVTFYLLDYFHLFVDLKTLARFPSVYYTLDLLIAVLLGLGFAYAKSDRLEGCVICLITVIILMFAYSLFEGAEHKIGWRKYLRTRWLYPALVATGLVSFIIQGWVLIGAYLALSCLLYIVYIAIVWKTTTGQAAGIAAPNSAP